MVRSDRQLWLATGTGCALGLLGVLLVVWGNPENSGICVSCFLENSAGALGLHGNARMQYLRPELIGFVLGAFASALLGKEFRSRGGSAPLQRVVLGVFLIVGCAVFIGCPIKAFLRLTAGDLTALAGVAGIVGGVWMGLQGLVRAVDFGPGDAQRGGGGLMVPGLFLLFLVFFLVRPAFLESSLAGSAARHAPWILALGSGLALGVLAQRSRFCITGSIRDGLLMGGRSPLLWGLLAFAAAGLIGNLGAGTFHPGLYGQPGAHLDYLWSFLGMGLVGWISVLIGGCPFRQLIKAGEGDADAGLVVIGMLVGGGLVQAWDLASTAAGVPLAGKAAVLAGFGFLLACCLAFRQRVAA